MSENKINKNSMLNDETTLANKQASSKKEENEISKKRMREQEYKCISKKLKERKCNLFFNYTVILRAMYCMDLEDYIFNANPWLSIVLFGKQQWTTHLSNLSLIDNFINVYSNDIKKESNGNSYEYPIRVKQMNELHELINDLVSTKDLPPVYTLCNEGEIESTNFSSLYIAFEQLSEITGLPYDVITGQRMLNLGIVAVNDLAKLLTKLKTKEIRELTELDPEILKELVKSNFEDIKTITTLKPEVIREFIKACNISDAEHQIIKHIMRQKFRLCDVDLIDNMIDGNNTVIKDEQQLLASLKYIVINPLFVNSFGAMVWIIMDTLSSMSPSQKDKLAKKINNGGLDENKTDIGRIDTEIKNLWEVTFRQVDSINSSKSEQINVCWRKENVYSLDNLIYSIMQTLAGGNDTTPSGKKYSLVSGTKRIRKPDFDGFEYYKTFKDSRYNTNKIRDKDEIRSQESHRVVDMHYEYDGKQELRIVKPFMVLKYNKISATPAGSNNSEGSNNTNVSELLMLLDTLFDMNVGVVYKNTEKIYFSTLKEEILYWVEIFEYQRETIDSYIEYINKRWEHDENNDITIDASQGFSRAEAYRIEQLKSMIFNYNNLVAKNYQYFRKILEMQHDYNKLLRVNKKTVNTSGCNDEISKWIADYIQTQKEKLVIITDKISALDICIDSDRAKYHRLNEQKYGLELAIQKNNEFDANKPFSSPYVVTHEAYYPTMSLTEETRSIKYVINPDNSPRVLQQQRDNLFNQYMDVVNRFSRSAEEILYNIEDMENKSFDNALSKHYRTIGYIQKALKECQIRRNSKLPSNKNDSTLFAVEGLYQSSCDLAEDMLNTYGEYQLTNNINQRINKLKDILHIDTSTSTPLDKGSIPEDWVKPENYDETFNIEEWQILIRCYDHSKDQVQLLLSKVKSIVQATP